MADELDDETAFLLLAAGTAPAEVDATARDDLAKALRDERYAPFAAELAALFALPLERMRELLGGVDAPGAWIRGVSPIEGQLDFRPGPSLAPLHAGLVRMQGGAFIPRHRHTHREVTYVLEGALVDQDGRRYGPGDVMEMPEGSVHAIGVPEGTDAVLALLHGRIEMLGE